MFMFAGSEDLLLRDYARRQLRALRRALLSRPAGHEVRAEELRRVTAALERLDHGSWGQCLSCARLIEVTSLLTHPQAEHCDRCVDLRSLTDGRRGHSGR